MMDKFYSPNTTPMLFSNVDYSAKRKFDRRIQLILQSMHP
jgi:hypothetical protein